MRYRRLEKTDLQVSEAGFGGKWLERHTGDECRAVPERAEALGINILDCGQFGVPVAARMAMARELFQ